MKKIIIPIFLILLIGIVSFTFRSKNIVIQNPLSPQQALYDTVYCPDMKSYDTMEEALLEPLKVVKLDISMRKLTVVPSDIVKFENLECLDLSFNRITTLPPEIVKLKKLRYINLAGTNYMAKVPAVLAQIPTLVAIDIADHSYWDPARFEEAKKLLPNVKVITK